MINYTIIVRKQSKFWLVAIVACSHAYLLSFSYTYIDYLSVTLNSQEIILHHISDFFPIV